MGWTFDWVSSGANGFNYDYAVTFSPEQLSPAPHPQLRHHAVR